MNNQNLIINEQDFIMNEKEFMESMLSHQLQEEVQHKNPDFPLARFIDRFDYFIGGCFPSHWHTEIEMAYVLKGKVEYQLNQQTFQLSEGEGIFISPQALHSARQFSPGSIVFNIVFLPRFLNLIFSASTGQKYLKPVMQLSVPGFYFSGQTEAETNILNSLHQIYLAHPCEYDYELSCMADFLQLWKNLLHIIQSFEAPEQTPQDILREQRMRNMVAYIHGHFMQSVTVEEIAASANISRSECFRCFSIFSGKSPMDYVNQCRLLYATQRLLESDDSVADICYACGFSSTSYFSKIFRQAYGVSPSAFRKGANNS